MALPPRPSLASPARRNAPRSPTARPRRCARSPGTSARGRSRLKSTSSPRAQSGRHRGEFARRHPAQGFEPAAVRGRERADQFPVCAAQRRGRRQVRLRSGVDERVAFRREDHGVLTLVFGELLRRPAPERHAVQVQVVRPAHVAVRGVVDVLAVDQRRVVDRPLAVGQLWTRFPDRSYRYSCLTPERSESRSRCSSPGTIQTPSFRPK